MPDENKIVLELELQVKQLQKDLKQAQSDINKFAKQTTKNTGSILKVLKGMRDDLKTIANSYKDINTAANRAGQTQTNAARQATREQKKLNDELKRTVELTGGKGDGKGGGKGGGFWRGEGSGFLAGLGRGTGLTGLVRNLQAPDRRYRVGAAIGRSIMGAGSGLLSFGLGGMQTAYGQTMQYGASKFGLTGLGGTRAQLGRATRVGLGLGFSPTETAQLAPGVMGATGALRATGTAQQLALAGGFGPGRLGEAVDYMGMMREAGSRFQGAGNLKARQKDLSKTIALGMESGLEKARLPEFFAGVGQLVRSQFATASGKVDANVIAKQLAQLGASGKAGFQGARGAQVMGQLDAMIRQPGGGEAGQALILQAMGFGKPGGKVNYYEALKRQQEGIRDPRNVRDIFQEVYRQRGITGAGGGKGNEEANLQLSEISGLSLKQVEDLAKIYNSNKTLAEQDKEIKEILKEAEPIDKQALRVSKEGFADVKKHLAGVEAMNIRVGSRFAKPMMQLQQFQLQLLDSMTKYLPQIIGWLKKIFELIMAVAAWLKGGKSVQENLKDISKSFDTQIAKLEKFKPKSVYELEKQERDLARFYERAAAERAAAMRTGSGGILGVVEYGLGGSKERARKAGEQYAPHVRKHYGRSSMVGKFNLELARRGMSEVGRDPEVIKAITRAIRAEDPAMSKKLYQEALNVAKKRQEDAARRTQRIKAEADDTKKLYSPGPTNIKIALNNNFGDARRNTATVQGQARAGQTTLLPSV